MIAIRTLLEKTTLFTAKILLYMLLFIGGAVIFIMILASVTQGPAKGQGLMVPFGGEIRSVSYECCYGSIITIHDVRTDEDIEMMLYPGLTQVFREYQLWSEGPNTVGFYFPFGICLDISGLCYQSVSYTDGSILAVGTSER